MFGLVFPCLNIACLYVLVESVGFGWLAWMLGLGLSKRCSSRLSWVQIWNTDNNPWNAFWQPLNKHHTESAWKWGRLSILGADDTGLCGHLAEVFWHMTWDLCIDFAMFFFTHDMGVMRRPNGQVFFHFFDRWHGNKWSKLHMTWDFQEHTSANSFSLASNAATIQMLSAQNCAQCLALLLPLCLIWREVLICCFKRCRKVLIRHSKGLLTPFFHEHVFHWTPGYFIDQNAPLVWRWIPAPVIGGISV